MATLVRDDGDVLTIRAVPAARVAIGFGLALSFLVHVCFELLQSPPARGAIRSALWLAVACVAVSCLMSRLVILRFDRRSRVLFRRTASVLGMRRETIPFSSIRAADLCRIRLLPGIMGEWFVLRTDDDTFRFGGMDWVNVDGARRLDWLAAIREAVWPSGGVACLPVLETGEMPLRFSLRRALIAVVIAAAMLGVSGWLKLPVQSRFVLAVLAAGCTLLVTSAARMHALLLVLATHYCPFLWMIRENVPWGTTSGLIESLPLAPAAWLAWPLAIAHVHPESAWWLSIAVPIQILCATWLASRSGRWTFAIWLGSFLLSAAGSFFFYAGHRM